RGRDRAAPGSGLTPPRTASHSFRLLALPAHGSTFGRLRPARLRGRAVPPPRGGLGRDAAAPRRAPPGRALLPAGARAHPPRARARRAVRARRAAARGAPLDPRLQAPPPPVHALRPESLRRLRHRVVPG